MKTAIAVLVVLFGMSWLFVDTAPGPWSLPFHESYLGFPIIGLGAWMLHRNRKSPQR